jgi:predicted NAD/FAD-dependent oxidoreductase
MAVWRADRQLGAHRELPDLLRIAGSYALPAMPVPFEFQRPVHMGNRLYVAGDHRDTSSIQGALVSGRRAARAVLKDLGITAVGWASPVPL